MAKRPMATANKLQTIIMMATLNDQGAVSPEAAIVKAVLVKNILNEGKLKQFAKIVEIIKNCFVGVFKC
jgi:hypothetical protein